VDDQNHGSGTSVDGFGITATRANDVVVVAVSGDLDMVTAPEVLKAVHSVGRMRSAALIVDLTRVTFLSVAGMNVLIDARRKVLPHRPFGVVADGPVACRPLKLLGIDTVVALYRTLDEVFVDTE
jgi:anti-sigma B factor antagonist